MVPISDEIKLYTTTKYFFVYYTYYQSLSKIIDTIT